MKIEATDSEVRQIGQSRWAASPQGRRQQGVLGMLGVLILVTGFILMGTNIPVYSKFIAIGVAALALLLRVYWYSRKATKAGREFLEEQRSPSPPT